MFAFVSVSVSVTPHAHVGRSAEICIACIYVYVYIYIPDLVELGGTTRSILVAGLWSSWRIEMVFDFCRRLLFSYTLYFSWLLHYTCRCQNYAEFTACVRHFNLGLQHVLMSWHFQKWMKCIAETGHLSSLSRLIYGPEYLDSREANGGGGS